MTVGDGGKLRPFHVQLPDVKPLIVHCQRRDPHDAAAALAVIPLCLYIVIIVCALLQCRETGHARRPPRKQLRDIEEPGNAACLRKTFIPADFSEGRLLGLQPVLISFRDVSPGLSLDAPHGAAGISDQQTICREKSHLGIVGDQRFPSLRVRLICRDPLFPVLSEDLLFLQKLHRISQRIAHGAAVDASAYRVQMHLRFFLCHQRPVGLFLILIPVEVRKIP